MSVLEIEMPKPQTLRRYGMDEDGFIARVLAQKGLCACCGRPPSPSAKDGLRRLVIDHRHVKGWAKMPAHERLKWVRGLVCRNCNHRVLGRFARPDLLEAGARYLRERDERWKSAA